MKYSTKTRIKAAALAVMLLLTSVPVSAISAVRAQAAETGSRIEFITNLYGTDPTVANVITGRQVQLKETPVGSAFANKIILRSEATQKEIEGNGSETDAEAVTITKNGSTWTVRFEDTFDLKTGDKEDDETVAKEDPTGNDQYSIRAVYINNTHDGTALEIAGVTDAKLTEFEKAVAEKKGVIADTMITALGAASGTTATSSLDLDVMSESYLVIKCTSAEGGDTNGGSPSFQVVKGSGTFAKITSATYWARDMVDNGRQVRGSTYDDDFSGTKEKVLTLYLDGDIKTYMTIYPQNTYPSTKTEGNRSNCIQKDTVFVIKYSPIYSNSIFLDVMTPQYAIERVEDQLNVSDGQTGANHNQSYIKMATGDSLDFVTQNFQLRTKSDLYNGDFRITWKWIPGAQEGDTSIPDKNPANNNTIRIGSLQTGSADTEGWVTATIQREKEDAYGTLTATVDYYVNGSKNMTSINARESSTKGIPTKYPVRVYGTGEPVDVKMYSFKKGDRLDDPPTEATKLNDEDGENLKDSYYMDAYQGGLKEQKYVDEYPFEIKEPFEYTLMLDMGALNGTASYAAIFLESGNADSVKIQWDDKTGTGAHDYNLAPAGTDVTANSEYAITNPKAKGGADTSDSQKIYVTFTAQERETAKGVTQSLKINIRFYIPNNVGTPQMSTDKFDTTFNIYDNSPSKEAVLTSLTIMGKPMNSSVKERIAFNFQPDNFLYRNEDAVIHLPYVIESIDITAFIKSIYTRNTDKMTLELLDGITTSHLDDSRYGSGTEDKSEENTDAYTLTHNVASKEIKFYTGDGTEGGKTPVTDEPYLIKITVPAQDPRRDLYWKTYELMVIRDPASENNYLSSLGVYQQNDAVTEENNLLNQSNLAQPNQKFDPEKTEYDIWLPYSTQTLRVLAQKDHARAKLEDLVVLAGDESSEKVISGYTLEGTNPIDPNKIWLNNVKKNFDSLLSYDDPEEDFKTNGVMTLKYTVISESGVVTEEDDTDGLRDYYVRLHRLDPSTEAGMDSLIITDNNNQEREYKQESGKSTTFDASYSLEMPYSVPSLRFNIMPKDLNVWKVELWEGEIGGKGKKLAKYVNGVDYEEDPENPDNVAPLVLGALSDAFPVKDITDPYAKKYQNTHPFWIRIWAEDDRYVTTYVVYVRRQEPSHDAALTNLVLRDGGKNEEIKTFAFFWDQHGCDKPPNKEVEGGTSYHVVVPYSTKQITFTPTTSHEYATVEIREPTLLGNLIGSIFPYTVQSGAVSKPFNLSEKTGPNNEAEFHVIVTAEDGKTRWVYCIKVSREPPSDDARLKSLTTQNTSKLKPQFLSSKLEYTADVNEGAPGVILTPTANHPGATIRVDGVVVQSGSPTDLIELLEITQTVRIEVIAEDGVTRMVYRVTFTNQNLIEKTSNADLRNLTVNYGLMTPNFQSAVLDYEVTTKENAWSVDIIPKLADPYATMRVLNGTLELGDYNGNYAMAIVDGLNEVSVEVTSPDGTVTKTYSVDIYRNDEEKLKNLKPLEAEDINFEQVGNPIIVKIEEYPRIGASVFNTIREEYPDRSIVFQGNDYSIRFDGENLTRVIPQTEIYDFRMTLTSPDEDAIYDLIAEYEYNDDIISDIVMLYFDYHGSLPGPASFSLSLGRHYANDLLYWHYYNQERDRIDYYGTLQSNSKGNIAVSIDHFSTYIVSPEHRIAGSEDKDGMIDELGMVSNGEDLLGSGGKLNPNTGVEERP